jgi:hypothetical protein
MPRRARDPLLQKLRAGVEAILSDPQATCAEKLKAIEIGSRLLLTEFKTSDKGDDRGFFG